MEKEALIIFAKNPILGKVKTRLAVDIGEEKALQVYLQLLEIVHSYTVGNAIKKIVYWDGGIPSNNLFVENEFTHKSQITGDLGMKMKEAISSELGNFQSVCIIGTDCVELNPEILIKSFQALNDNDIVIGPAVDGGYYLLGLKKIIPEIFEEIPWSTSSVYDQTVKKIKNMSLSYFTLPSLSDVDNYTDLLKMREKKLIH